MVTPREISEAERSALEKIAQENLEAQRRLIVMDMPLLKRLGLFEKLAQEAGLDSWGGQLYYSTAKSV